MEMLLTTERLELRLVSSGDLAAVHELHRLPETNRFNTLGIPSTLEQTQNVLQDLIVDAEKAQNPAYTFGIRERAYQEFIGLIALKCGNPKFRIGEVWYKLHVDHWGKGYATEALERILQFGFADVRLHRIEAGCAVENEGSIRVLEKVGMLREGRKRKVLPLDSGWSDNFFYAILEEDWNSMHTNQM